MTDTWPLLIAVAGIIILAIDLRPRRRREDPEPQSAPSRIRVAMLHEVRCDVNTESYWLCRYAGHFRQTGNPIPLTAQARRTAELLAELAGTFPAEVDEAIGMLPDASRALLVEACAWACAAHNGLRGEEQWARMIEAARVTEEVEA